MKAHHPHEWPESELAQAWLIEVEREGELEALLWFSVLWEDVLECHAVARPDVRGRWLKRDLHATLHHAVRDEIGASAVVAQIYDPHVGRIWRRLVFTVLPNFAVLDMKD